METVQIPAFTGPVCTLCWGNESVLLQAETWYGAAVCVGPVRG